MADGTRPAVGLSVGATSMAAVTSDRAVVRRPVMTLFRHRAPQIGVPSDNPDLHDSGLVITDFVERVGDPVGIVASDGSVHRSEVLLADALRALAYAGTGGRPLPEAAAVTYPAHWRSAAVSALRTAVGRVPEWSHQPPALISDTAAAVTALQADPGIPTRGVIALCDFGGSGTSITLVDAANGYRPIGPTVRHADFSGDLIDRTLLAHVIADLSTAGSLDVSGTSAIGPLTRLRAECRGAKERLSASTVTALTADLPGFRGGIRLTRTELDDAIRQPLDDFVGVLLDTMNRNGIRRVDVTAVASTGGGASIPAITTTLSEHLRVPVITTPRPQLTAATGGALRAARGPADESATVLAPAAAAMAPDRALAWSEAHDVPAIAPARRSAHPAHAAKRGGLTTARPQLEFEHDEPAAIARLSWYRRPLSVVAGTLLVIAAAGAGTVVALRSDRIAGSVSPTPSISTTPGALGPSLAEPPPAENPASQQAAPAPQTRTVVQVPAPVTQTQTVEAPPRAAMPPPAAPPASEPPPSMPPSTDVQPPTDVTPSTAAPPATEVPAPSTPPRLIPQIPTIPPIPTIPGLPSFIPQPQAFIPQPPSP